MQIAKKISRLILPDDLNEVLEHRPWHGKQPITLTAVTLYIATHLGERVMMPGLGAAKIGQIAEVCGVSPSTIEATYAELHSELFSMIPPGLKPPLTKAEWEGMPAPRATKTATPPNGKPEKVSPPRAKAAKTGKEGGKSSRASGKAAKAAKEGAQAVKAAA